MPDDGQHEPVWDEELAPNEWNIQVEKLHPLQVEVRNVEKRLRQLRRQWLDYSMERLEHDLDEALREGRKATSQAIARKLAGTGISIRKVEMGMIPSQRLTEEELTEFGTRDADKGRL